MMVFRNQSGYTRVLVVEDDKKTAQLVRLYLEREGYEVSVAQTGVEALELSRVGVPSLVILDLMLPGIDGIDVCSTLRKISGVLILMLTARATEADTIRGLDAGADDYMTKPFSPRELVARVRALLRRVPDPASSGDDGVVRRQGLVVDTVRRSVSVSGSPRYLTPVEYRLLLAMMAQPGRVFTRAQLIEVVYGHDYEGFERSIDAHILRLRQKIEVDRNSPQYVKTVYGVGYKFAEEDE